MAEPTETEINEVLDKCAQACNEGSKFPGMSYEEGVKYAIEWMHGEGDHPFDD